MSEKQRLLDTLFSKEGGIEHINIKFCRGTAEDISVEDLCRAANWALLQHRVGIATVSRSFGDGRDPVVDVREVFRG